MAKWTKHLAATLLLASSKFCLAGFSYSVTEIAAPNPPSDVDASSLNDAGDVTGTIFNGIGRTPFIYRGQQLSNLIEGTGATYGFGSTIDQNLVVGGDAGSSSDIEPATFSKGKMHLLPTDGKGGDLIGGNSSGDFVGYISEGNSWTAASWTDGKLQVLKNIPGTASEASAINNNGKIIGSYKDASGRRTAFTLIGGKVQTLKEDSYTVSQANDVNDKGDVVGVGSDPNGKFSNFAIISSRVVPLNPLPGGQKYGPDAAGGEAINNADQIAGASEDANGNNRAVLFEDGKTIDLNTEINPNLGYSLDSAVDINNRGQILVQGMANGQQASFILTPHAIPLPASVWMGLTTLPLLGIALRRKRCVA